MLLDSNIIIYAANPGYKKIRDYISKIESKVSIISKIEVMGYHHLTPENTQMLNVLFQSFQVINISDDIVKEAISLRQQQKISLGDSLIAATAIVHKLDLVTANTKDFEWISDLKVINPVEH